MFIAIVGISSGPKFVAGLQQLGFGIFLWGIFATTLPLILAPVLARQFPATAAATRRSGSQVMATSCARA